MIKERVIYNNYNLCDMYDDAKDFLINECGYDEEEISEDAIWQEVYFNDEHNFDDAHYELKHFFDGNGYFMLRGYVGRWDGRVAAGYVFDDFDDMFYKAVKDCNYVKIWDEDGHFYLQCSHHDGTDTYEIKRINERAYDFIDKWNYSWSDKRTEEEIHDIVWNSNFFSSLPHYAHTVWGCKRRERCA